MAGYCQVWLGIALYYLVSVGISKHLSVFLSIARYCQAGADRESDGWGGGTVRLAFTGLSNISNAWLFLDLKIFLLKNIRGRGFYSSLISKHLKNN